MLQNKSFHVIGLLAVVAGLLLSGCDSTTNVNNPSQSDITLQFTTGSSSSANAAYSNQVQQTGDMLEVEGSNGTLVIHDIRFIVEDFELERADGACEDAEDAEDGDDECEEFESDPFFVDLPLQEDTLNLDTTPIEAGLYEGLEFEIDDLDLDEEDEEDQNAKEQLAEQVRQEFPDWPDEVSMVIIGDFNSSDGGTTSFKTFAEAEIEIEMEFNPPLEVGDNADTKLINVNITPKNWFLREDGTVVDLSEYDYESTGKILEFEKEMEDGFDGLDTDDDGDDDGGGGDDD